MLRILVQYGYPHQVNLNIHIYYYVCGLHLTILGHLCPVHPHNLSQALTTYSIVVKTQLPQSGEATEMRGDATCKLPQNQHKH